MLINVKFDTLGQVISCSLIYYRPLVIFMFSMNEGMRTANHEPVPPTFPTYSTIRLRDLRKSTYIFEIIAPILYVVY